MRWLLVLLLAGCAHARIEAGSTTSTSTSAGGQVSVHVHSRSLAAVVIAGMFLASAAEELREPRPFPSFSSFADWFRGTPTAELDPTRSVSEQDCTRPVDYSLGNIRCK